LYDDGLGSSSSDIVMASSNDEKVDIAIMVCDDATAVPAGERKANARLIAAAPAMKTALEAIANDCVAWLNAEMNIDPADLLAAIRSAAEVAIAKAEVAA